MSDTDWETIRAQAEAEVDAKTAEALRASRYPADDIPGIIASYKEQTPNKHSVEYDKTLYDRTPTRRS